MSSEQTSLEYNRHQLHVLGGYFEAIKEAVQPPFAADDPLHVMGHLNELSCCTLQLAVRCQRVFGEKPEGFFPELKNLLGKSCRVLTIVCLSFSFAPQQFWDEDSWHDPRDFASPSALNGNTYGEHQLFGRFHQLVMRVIDCQQTMQEFPYSGRIVEHDPILAVLRRLWGTFASIAVNLNTELAQVLIEDLEQQVQAKSDPS